MRKKLFRLNSISIKVIVIYIALAVMNIAYFTSIVFENQVDLITQNSRWKTQEKINTIIKSLKNFSEENKRSAIFKRNRFQDNLDQIEKDIKNLHKDYAIFTENGKILRKSAKTLQLRPSYIQDGMKAIADLDFTGMDYYLPVDAETYKMYFYIPLQEYGLKNLILYIPEDLSDPKTYRSSLYSQVILIIIITSIFHIIFAFLLFRVIINPVRQLQDGTTKISSGDLYARVKMNRKDEFGQLAGSFNRMADSIQEKVETLEATTEEMEVINEYVNDTNKSLEEAKRIADRDMEMAVNVQRSFYADAAPETNKWETAFIFRPASGVSGDLYDFYVYDDKLFGASIFDVSGHGIASGLITMLAKAVINRSFSEMRDNNLNEIIHAVNNELISQIDNVDNYLTGILLKMDTKKNTISYVNAGHTDLLMKSHKTGKVKVVGGDTDFFRGSLLGIGILSRDYEVIDFSMNANDSLLLYTDCFFDAINEEGERFEMERIIEAYEKAPDGSAEEILSNIMDQFDAFVKDKKLSDDLTVMIIKKKKSGKK